MEETRQSPGDERLAWTVHLLAERPARSIAVIVFLAAVCLVVLRLYGALTFVLAVFLLGTSLGPFFFPTHYELTAEGPRRRILFLRTERRWSEFRRYDWDEDGVKLSPFSRPGRLEPFRGFFLRFDGNREEVLAYLARHLRGPEGEERARS